MADVKISALPPATTPLTGSEVLPIVQSGTTDKVSVADLTAGRAVNTGDLTADGNLNITGTARRITGDFSNATPSNRVSFQSSTTNGGTALTVIPNGTSTTTNLLLYNAADPTNASIMQVRSSGDGGLHGIQSTTSGSGTLLPINFFIGGGERMRIDTAGNVGIGTSSPAWRFTVVGGSTQISPGTSAQEGVRFTRSTGVCTINGINNDNNAYNALTFATGASEAMRIDTAGNVVAGGSVALATTATNGFLYVPTCAGVPTGTPTAITGMAPIVVNTTNNKLYFYSGGAWRDAGP